MHFLCMCGTGKLCNSLTEKGSILISYLFVCTSTEMLQHKVPENVAGLIYSNLPRFPPFSSQREEVWDQDFMDGTEIPGM